ncbi:Protein of unknown function [Pyronema omphalodes CBS 100304]|uniref:Uncharacterized protein n=1 Tax=Pyronema omphalodes (strain CBS 100304) TaxID=1076935 RepID=U4LRL3_PYROM|nr:Protein of unknown function [Pyronema omphalodes CBS 100304]
MASCPRSPNHSNTNTTPPPACPYPSNQPSAHDVIEYQRIRVATIENSFRRVQAFIRIIVTTAIGYAIFSYAGLYFVGCWAVCWFIILAGWRDLGTLLLSKCPTHHMHRVLPGRKVRCINYF